MSLNIKSNYENDSWIIQIEGELDVSCAKNFKNEVESSLEKKFSDVKIDMEKLSYIDSTGVGVIVGIMKTLRRSGKDIVLLNAKDNIKKIFKITGIDQIVRMEG